MVSTILDLTDVECMKVIDELKILDPKVQEKTFFVKNHLSLSLPDALQYVVTDEPALWAKVYLNWTARPYQGEILAQCKRARRLVLRLGRRLGKCLPGDTVIPDPMNGQLYTVKELFERQSADIHTLDFDTKIKPAHTKIIFENGIKPVYKVTTASGKEIRATGNHPLLTASGWKDIDDLKAGDYVATPSRLSIKRPEYIPENELIMLAYMIGDGNATNQSYIRFSSVSEKIIDEMSEVLDKEYKCQLKKYESSKESDFFITSKTRSRENEVIATLRKYDVMGRNSHTKTIPDQVLSLSNEQLSIFLSRLFATDGWATSSFKTKGRSEIGYCSVSLEMIRRIQHLLLRFGIHATIFKKKVKYNGSYNVAYHLIICSSDDIISFADQIGIFSKEEAVEKAKNISLSMRSESAPIPAAFYEMIEEECEENGVSLKSMRYACEARIDKGKYNTISKRKVRKIAEHLDSSLLRDLCDNDIFWEQITSIVYEGEEPTYDLTVPVTNNFVANDFITHNTEDMCVSILWHAFTQPNKIDLQYDILILAPFETQIDLIFNRLDQLINASPIMSAEISRSINHRYELKNGTNIQGLTVGSGNGKAGASTRGQRADLLVFDEQDYIDSETMTNALNIANENPAKIKIVVASTPSGRHDEFYKWCQGASHTYRPLQEDIDNFQFTEYQEEHSDHGNGWTQVYAPSTVNKTLLQMNPDTQQTYLQDIKDELTDQRYQQEVMAEFGEEAMGVYKKEHIQRALDLSRKHGLKYFSQMSSDEMKTYIHGRQRNDRNILIAGVDWDLAQATPVLVAVELDKNNRDDAGQISPIFKVVHREEMPRTEFTMDNAISRIIELHSIYDFDWIAADRGYGDVQIEMMKKYGMEHPETLLHQKLIGYHLGSKIEIKDPHTMKKEKKNFKPFMVNNSVRIFERNKIVLNPADKVLRRQLENFRIKSISSNGIPTYTDTDEHSVDAMNLALVCFEQKYGELMRTIISTKFIGLNGGDPFAGLVADRSMNAALINFPKGLGFSRNDGHIVDVTGSRRKNRRPSAITRSFTR